MEASPRVAEKWRPPLSLIVFAVLLIVLMLPTAVVIWFRAIDHTTSRMGPIEVAALAVALLLTLALGFVLSRTLTRPINALIARTQAIARGGRAGLSAQEQHGTRELAILSQSFLDLAGQLVDRSEYISSFAAHVGHELKSPLTAIRGSAELLRDAEMTPEERRRFLDHIIADSERLDALLGRLRELARAEVPIGRDLGAPLGAALPDLRERFPELEITVTGQDSAGNRPVALSTEAALIVLGHLADNARQHGATRLGIGIDAAAGRVIVEVGDNGSGIPPAVARNVFEPFFTTRREEGGTGMGLEIVRRMLEAHGGTIALQPSTTGASFRLELPLAG